MKFNKERANRIALGLSICLLVLWSVLGTGTSLAWFTDTEADQKNVFQIGSVDLDVRFKKPSETEYKRISSDTSVFDENVRYEPGYVQVVYLKIVNMGTIPFDFKTAISVTDRRGSVNVYGDDFDLYDYVRFGCVSADTEAELTTLLKERDAAQSAAVHMLNSYSPVLESLAVGEEKYAALIVMMPEEVGNEANYRKGEVPPELKLGVVINASQEGTPVA